MVAIPITTSIIWRFYRNSKDPNSKKRMFYEFTGVEFDANSTPEGDVFPDFPDENIIMGKQKHLIKFDIIFEDCPDNVFRSTSSFPVLMRRPWNNDVTGLLSVNNLEDFLQLIHQIKSSIPGITNELHTPAVVALVGPYKDVEDKYSRLLFCDINTVLQVSNASTLSAQYSCIYGR